MATLSQHYDRNFDVNPYYVPIDKQPSPMYDKSKKTWSQRLKISKSEKATTQMVVPQLPPPQLQQPQLQINEYTGGLEFSPGALSRSMKYAEPWIYGTVRGIPARPMQYHPAHAMFAPMPSEIAVVICSCPEYLNGTKREVKKASICKKCKGSRLPLAPIGGTVRIRPTSAPMQQKMRPTNAATLRVVSCKSRPSILDQQRDPYDLMRRTRLLSPEPKSSPQLQEKNYRPSRGKSTSPNRSRSRTPRSQMEETSKASPKQTPSAKGSKIDRWIVEDQSLNDSNHRRSILRCNVNPYDLISNKSTSSSSGHQHHLSEFSPNHDDDDDDEDDVIAEIFGGTTSPKTINQKAAISRKTTGLAATLPSPSPSTASSSSATTGSSYSAASSSSKTINYANVKAIAGQRISFGENTTSSSLITQNGDSFMYENVTPVSLDNETTTTTSSGSPKALKQQHSAKKDDNVTLNQPKRPPRRKNDVNPNSSSGGDDADNGIVVATPSNEHHHQMSSQISTDLLGPASQRPSIKSILKRPQSAPASGVHLAGSTLSKSSLNDDTDTGSLADSITDSCRYSDQHHHNHQKQQQHHHHHHNPHHQLHQIKRNSTGLHESPVKSAALGSAVDTMVVISNVGQKIATETKTTGSQFYIPMPQARKKVQFMVEDKIIQVENANYGLGSNNNNNNSNDDEDEYHSAQGDEDDDDNDNDKSEILGKTPAANYHNCYVGTAVARTTRKLPSKSTPVTDVDVDYDNDNDTGRDAEDNVTFNDGDIIENPKDKNASTTPVATGATATLANRFGEEQLHRQRQLQLHHHHQHHQQQQEAVLHILQHESDLVSSELLNSDKNPYYQNLLNQNNSQELEDEPHYEDVANDDVNRHHYKDDGNPCGDDGFNSSRTTGSSSGDLKTTTKETPNDAMTTIPTPPSSVSRNAIRRTNSERHPCNVNSSTSSNNVILNFKDTMALRMKATRKDSRDLFTSNAAQQSVGLFRPKEPPPPPPTGGATAANRLNNTRTTVATNEAAPKPAAAIAATTTAGSSKTQTIQITATNDDNNKNSNDYDSVDDGATEGDNDGDNNEQQQGHPSRNRKLSVSSSGLEEQKLPPAPFIKDDANHRKSTSPTAAVADSSRKNIYETFDSRVVVDAVPSPKYPFGIGTSSCNSSSTNQPNRTVVRVAPFNKTSSEIHRLKITHIDDDIKAAGGAKNSTNGTNCNQKKTSILINGDDCYSTVNVTNDTPLYQSSVVVADGSSIDPMLKVSSNTVTINVVSSSPRTPEEELIYKNNKINTLLSRCGGGTRAIIPIGSGGGGGGGVGSAPYANLSDPGKTSPKRGRTLITLDYDKSPSLSNVGCNAPKDVSHPSPAAYCDEVFSHEEELVKILRNPVEAVRRNLVPHICGKAESVTTMEQPKSSDVECKSSARLRKRHRSNNELLMVPSTSVGGGNERNSFVGKLLEDPTLSHLAEGLEGDVVAKLIENSLKRLKESRNSIDTSGTKDNEDMNRLINMCLQRIREERQKRQHDADDNAEIQSNRGSISSGNSFSSANYEMFDFSDANESDCYQSCSSEIAADIETPLATRSKFYQMLVDATLAEIEISTNTEDDHHYESIRGNGNNGDPIYEEISDIPPPLPLSPPPLNDPELEKKAARSMFEGASKYDILSYLVDAKERGLVREESFEYNINNTSNPIIIEEENDTLSDLKQISDMSSRISHLSVTSDSSEDNNSLAGSTITDRLSVISALRKGTSSEIERNDSGVGSETSKSSRSKYQNNPQTGSVLSKISPIHLCEDCDGPVETQVTDSGVMFAPLVCRKCGKKRAERKEIITEIVETEEKYGRDLQIILEEFCQPMLVAGLLTQEQLSAIFLNTEELLENNQTLAERMRDALDIALEQGDDDLLTVNIGKIFLEFTQVLHAFESYCVRQAGASLLLANLEKEKELLRIFLKVSQMENTVLRRMNLNSFLMVPVQRVTKYPLLLARLYKVTPPHLDGRDLLKQAQEKIELHLTHINQEAKDVPTKLWRRISSSSPNRRASCEIDMINIKLRKMAIDILEWNHDEVRFAMEGKLMYTQPTDSNWKKGRTIKLNPVNALLVTNGKPSANYKAEKSMSDQLNFPKHTGIREASLLVVKEKCGRYTLIREPLYLDRCIVCTEADWDDYFELQEISSKDTFIFKAEDGVRTKQWYTQLQYHAQGMGAWRKRRNALANIMINGMLSRT